MFVLGTSGLESKPRMARTIEQRVERLEDQQEDVVRRLDDIDRLCRGIDEEVTALGAGFGRRFELMEARFERVGERIDKQGMRLDDRIDRLEAKVIELIGGLESRIGGLESRIGGLESVMGHLDAMIGVRFKSVETTLAAILAKLS